MAFLEGLTAVDLGITFQSGKHFAVVTDMSEEFQQNVSYQGAFGSDGPVLRRIRPADEATVTFTAVLLKDGVAAGMNDETLLKSMRDFEVQTKRGDTFKTYRGCNWTRVTIRSTLDNVTLDGDITIPGFDAGVNVASLSAAG